jgi:hypothetical protein
MKKAALLLLLQLFCMLAKGQDYQTGMEAISPPERSPFSWHARVGVMVNNADVPAKLYLKDDSSKYQMINLGVMTTTELSFNLDLLRRKAITLGLQISAMVAQPGLHVTSRFDDYLVGVTDLGIAKGTIWMAYNASGDPWTMFSVPYHGQGESLIGITGLFAETRDIPGAKPGNDTLDLKLVNGNTCRAIGAYIGWNRRLGQSGWVFGIHASILWRLKDNYLINFETNDSSRYTSGTLPFEPRMITGGFGYHF